MSRKHVTSAHNSLARGNHMTTNNYKGPRNALFGQVTTSNTYTGYVNLFLKLNSQRTFLHGTFYKTE